MIITEEFLQCGRSKLHYALTRKQHLLLGEAWPPVHGWRKRLLGKEITIEQAAEFILLREIKTKKDKQIKELNENVSLSKTQRRKAKVKAKKQARLKSYTVIEKTVKANLGKINHTKIYKPKITSSFAISDQFLVSYEWRRLRMEALKLHGSRCQCCGATPADGLKMNVDHIKPRKLFPQLALTLDNLQVLCEECNHGKGNWDMTDWRNKEIDLTEEQLNHIKSI